jgi:hypothetical protein
VRGDEPFPILPHKRQQIGPLFRRQIDLPNAEEENGVEIIEVANVELFARRDAGAGGKRDRMLCDDLRVGSNERIVGARFAAETFDGRDRMRNRVVLVTVSDVRPRQHVLARRRRARLLPCHRRPADEHGNNRRTRGPAAAGGHFAAAGRANAAIFDPGVAPR